MLTERFHIHLLNQPKKIKEHRKVRRDWLHLGPVFCESGHDSQLEGCQTLPLGDFIVSSLQVGLLKGESSPEQKMRVKPAKVPMVDVYCTFS